MFIPQTLYLYRTIDFLPVGTPLCLFVEDDVLYIWYVLDGDLHHAVMRDESWDYQGIVLTECEWVNHVRYDVRTSFLALLINDTLNIYRLPQFTLEYTQSNPDPTWVSVCWDSVNWFLRDSSGVIHIVDPNNQELGQTTVFNEVWQCFSHSGHVYVFEGPNKVYRTADFITWDLKMLPSHAITSTIVKVAGEPHLVTINTSSKIWATSLWELYVLIPPIEYKHTIHPVCDLSSGLASADYWIDEYQVYCVTTNPKHYHYMCCDIEYKLVSNQYTPQ